MAPSVRFALNGLQEVVVGRGEARGGEESIRDGQMSLRIDVADQRMSAEHARLVASGKTWKVVDAGSKNGTSVNGQRVKQAYLQDRDLVEIGRTMFVYRAPGLEAGLQRETRAESLSGRAVGLRTLSGAFDAQLAALGRVAGSDVPIAVYGPTGTGKELTARAIHELSGRKGDFIAVNCGAIAGTLIESELFGYKKGAFSGAVEDRVGLVRAAHKGTLLLDEIADLPAPAQVALLRVLQEREVLPVGDTAPVPVDVRIITATHRDLELHVEDGTFREDLFARLTGAAIALPPLAERPEDLGMLVADVLSHIGARPLSRSAARALFAYDWPRNIRELHRVIEATVAENDRRHHRARSAAHGDPRSPRRVQGHEPGRRARRGCQDRARRSAPVAQGQRDSDRQGHGKVARSLSPPARQVQRRRRRLSVSLEPRIDLSDVVGCV